MSTDYQFLLFEEDKGVGVLTLNREDKLNALSIDVLKELKSFLLSAKESQTLKSLIFTGAGEKAFIAGADIAGMSQMNVSEGEEFAKLGQEVTLLFESLPVPVIAAVNGFALGGGCEMAMSADFIFCTQNAVFGQPEVKLGLIPGFGGTQRLAKLIGRARAKELIYTGRNMKAQEALQSGLALAIYDSKQELLTQAKECCLKMQQNSPHAIKIAKSVMNRGNDLTVAQGLGIEAQEFGNIFDSYDMKEGTKAFVEKRRAEFQGR